MKAKKELLVVSFGTTHADTREKTIGAIEDSLAAAFPEYEVKRAFSSGVIINRLRERDGIHVMDMREALEDALNTGVTELILQPTHLMNGHEYEKLSACFADYRERFAHAAIGAPLLSSVEDYERLAAAVRERTAGYDDGQTAICLMGHGTDADANVSYQVLQEIFDKDESSPYYIATVEAEPTFRDITEQVIAAGRYKRVILLPLMIVAGDHAVNDMAGEKEDSWKRMLEDCGLEVIPVLEGLGEYPAVHAIFADHAKAAMTKIRKPGTFYGVGAGPGDPELMTLKAARLIREAGVIACPGEAAEQSVAFQIAAKVVPEIREKELLSIPMPMVMDRETQRRSHREGADRIEQILNQGKNVVFLTLGDPTIYSTVSYLQHYLEGDGYPVELISGVPSFCAAAAALKIPLAEWTEELHIIPALHQQEMAFDYPGNYVLMKSGSHMKRIKKLLQKSGKSVSMAENLGLPGEHLYTKLEDIPETAGYFSLIIAKE